MTEFPSMMKLALASLVLLVPLAGAVLSRCPEPSVLIPCFCAEHYAWGSEVTCRDFNNPETLQKVFDNTYSFDMLNLENCTIQYLKNTWFSSKGIYKLHIDSVTAVDLFHNEGDATAPSVTNMQLNKIKVLRGVRWQQFKPFTHLKTLYMFKTEVKKLGKDFRDVSSRLQSMAIEQAGLKALEDGDLDGKTELNSISFMNNKIKVLKNSFFKDQKAVLTNIHFSGNPIESIPDDLFEGMAQLRYVYIRGAQIKTLSRMTNSRGILLFIHLGENPLECDCKMKWITTKKDISIEGACETPSFLKSKRLSDLTQNDFGACRNSLPFEH